MRILLMAMGFLFGSSLTFGQEICGFVDRSRCRQVVMDRSIIRDHAPERQTQFDDSLRILAWDYDQFLRKGLRHRRKGLRHGAMDSLAIVSAEQGLRMRQEAIFELQDRARAALEKRETELLRRIDEVLADRSMGYCQKKGLCILSVSESLLFGAGCVDHTDGFIAYLIEQGR